VEGSRRSGKEGGDMREGMGRSGGGAGVGEGRRGVREGGGIGKRIFFSFSPRAKPGTMLVCNN
jgi:hypothetical protein